MDQEGCDMRRHATDATAACRDFCDMEIVECFRKKRQEEIKRLISVPLFSLLSFTVQVLLSFLLIKESQILIDK
jgi:hypothetical protein